MIVFPRAKINLGLNVVRLRNDSFHDIETVFYPIGLHDNLEIINQMEKTSFDTVGIVIPGGGEDNICLKAYAVLKKEFDLPPISIFLHKLIPIGAGLGGGSSDGACMLKVLNELFTLRLSEDQLEVYARQLGSDCAFFIRENPTYAFGKGDKFEPIRLDLSAYEIALVNPGIHVSTQAAYAGVRPKNPERNLKELIKLDIRNWRDVVVNDFESSVFLAHPEVKMIKEKLYKEGALFSLMSGSGSSVFAIFEKVPEGLEQSFANCFFWKGKL